MNSYRIMKETSPNEFTPTGEVFEGTMEEVNAYIAELKGADGVCRAAEVYYPSP